MKDTYIKRVELKEIHKRYDLSIDFDKSLNILYGQNGTGKSTLIHIMANVANCDFIRFSFLDFSSIKITYSNGAHVFLGMIEEDGDKVINIETDSGANLSFKRREAYETIRQLEDEKYSREYDPVLIKKISEFVKENNIRHIETSYFPAFRTMLEAWSSQNENGRMHPRRTREISTTQATSFSRKLFGQFLPAINYPSPSEIESSLRDEIRDRQISIARYEISVFSDSFVKVFSALLEGKSIEASTDQLLQEIFQLTADSTGSKLGDFEENSNTFRELQELVKQSSSLGEHKSSASGALAVYRDALKERRSFQQEAFREIDTYFEVVNSFLDKKELSYALDKNRRIPKVGLKFPDGTWSSIQVMSSGERQLLTMLYAVNRMSRNATVLIDEPEISLHIDWQEDLLDKMMEQLGDRQIIVCTHSPAIAAGFDEYMKEVCPIFNDVPVGELDHSDDEDDL